MRHYLDLGTHKFEGLAEFTEKLNLGADDNVYCFEPNKKIYEISRESDKVTLYEQKFHSFKHANAAIMNYSGTIWGHGPTAIWANTLMITQWVPIVWTLIHSMILEMVWFLT